jgi:hypothetical protein
MSRYAAITSSWLTTGLRPSRWPDAPIVLESLFSARARTGSAKDGKPRAAPAEQAGTTARAMKDEYDFSKAERGRFFRQDAIPSPPVHLDPEVLAFLIARAQARGTSLSELVNALLKKDIELIEAAEWGLWGGLQRRRYPPALRTADSSLLRLQRLSRRARGGHAQEGDPDGRISVKSRSAIKSFQLSQGLVPDGFATADMLDRLRQP